jgi:tRNA-specific 2-thiouridylase
MNRKRVFVAMSGGVDSSLTAALLKEEGYEVIGVSMELWCEQRHGLSTSRPTCCSIEDIGDARRVCHILDIPFYTLNLEDEFQTYVVDYLCNEYAQGRTPNPCIACNQQIKFKFLLNKALSSGADYLATGHFAKIEYSEGEYHLLKGTDPVKEQSYFLYTLGQAELQYLLFPLGCYIKSQVRRMAAERGLPVAEKPKSQDLCFVPDGDYRAFLKKYIPSSPGKIVDTEGKVMGRHDGITSYTIGQRCRSGLNSGIRLYVIAIDPDSNTLVVDSEDKLFNYKLFATEVRYVSDEPPQQPIPIDTKLRYRSLEAAAMLYPDGDTAEIQFYQSQRAIAPGQAVVFYQDDQVLGGGIIASNGELRSFPN